MSHCDLQIFARVCPCVCLITVVDGWPSFLFDEAMNFPLMTPELVQALRKVMHNFIGDRAFHCPTQNITVNAPVLTPTLHPHFEPWRTDAAKPEAPADVSANKPSPQPPPETNKAKDEKDKEKVIMTIGVMLLDSCYIGFLCRK